MATSLCPAMKRAGINDARSLEGMSFCTKRCPYENGCILFSKRAKMEERQELVVKMHSKGIGSKDISLILRMDLRTVRKYIYASMDKKSS